MGRRLDRVTYVAIIFSAALFLVGCGDDYCGESGTGIPLVKVYTLDTPAVSATIDSVTVYGKNQKRDSVLYDNQNISSFYTPLNIDSAQVQYVLKYNKKSISEENRYDTLTYKYAKELVFDTPECGAAYIYTIIGFEYTRHSIVYAELVTPVVNNLSSETVNIYYAAKN